MPTGAVDSGVGREDGSTGLQLDHDDRTGRPLLPRRVRRAVLGIALLGLVLRLAMAAQPLTFVDRLFVPDDAYYALAIARSLAEGLGPSADSGATLTTGFQPLIVLLTVPSFWLGADPGVPLRAALVVSSVADVAAIVLLARLATRIAGPAAGLVAAALWAVSPYALGVSLNGLESSLALALSLALVEAWCLAPAHSGLWWWSAVGALAGLALLARIDTVFLVALLGLVELATSRRLRPLLVAGTAAAVVSLPWWLYSAALTGSPVPESAAAVQELVEVHRRVGLGVADSLGLAVGRVVGAPVVDLPALRRALVDHPSGALATAAILCLVMTAAAAWAGTRRRAGVRQLPILALGLHAVALVVFYGVVNALPWFFDRYLLPVAAVLGLALAAVVGRLWSAATADRSRGRMVGSPPLAAVAALFVLALLTVPAVESARLLGARPEGSVDRRYEGAKGYAEVARDVLAQLPPGAVVGSLQSGALGYFAEYAPQGVQVVNLDGVVDGDAASALERGRLADYMHERGVTHFADWPFNSLVLESHSAASRVGTPTLEGVGAAGPQAGERFHISRVRYADAP